MSILNSPLTSSPMPGMVRCTVTASLGQTSSHNLQNLQPPFTPALPSASYSSFTPSIYNASAPNMQTRAHRPHSLQSSFTARYAASTTPLAIAPVGPSRIAFDVHTSQHIPQPVQLSWKNTSSLFRGASLVATVLPFSMPSLIYYIIMLMINNAFYEVFRFISDSLLTASISASPYSSSTKSRSFSPFLVLISMVLHPSGEPTEPTEISA